MLTYCYRCSDCRDEWEFPHRMTEDAVCWCQCGGELRRVPMGGASVMRRGTPYVNGERRLSMAFETRNRDGSESRYMSLREAAHGERDRGVAAPVVKKNLEYLRRQGYVPGTWQHDFKQACMANNREGK